MKSILSLISLLLFNFCLAFKFKRFLFLKYVLFSCILVCNNYTSLTYYTRYAHQKHSIIHKNLKSTLWIWRSHSGTSCCVQRNYISNFYREERSNAGFVKRVRTAASPNRIQVRKGPRKLRDGPQRVPGARVIILRRAIPAEGWWW